MMSEILTTKFGWMYGWEFVVVAIFAWVLVNWFEFDLEIKELIGWGREKLTGSK